MTDSADRMQAAKFWALKKPNDITMPTYVLDLMAEYAASERAEGFRQGVEKAAKATLDMLHQYAKLPM